MQKKKPAKAPARRAKKKEETTEPKQNPIKRLIFGEEKLDLTELEAGSTTILDILSPTAINTQSRDYIQVDGVYCRKSAASPTASAVLRPLLSLYCARSQAHRAEQVHSYVGGYGFPEH